MSSEKGLRVLDAYGFGKKIDDNGDFNEGRMLYYRNIMDNQYVIFSSYESKKGTITGFDFWLSKYSNTSEIGEDSPEFMQKLKFSFDFDDDIELLKKYLPNQKPKQIRNISALSFKSIISMSK